MSLKECGVCATFSYGNSVVGLPAGFCSMVGDDGHLPPGPGAKQVVRCPKCKTGGKKKLGYCTKLGQSGHLTTDRMQKIPDSASKAKRKDKATPASPASSAKKKKTIATVAAAPVVGKTGEESGNPAEEDDAWSPYPDRHVFTDTCDAETCINGEDTVVARRCDKCHLCYHPGCMVPMIGEQNQKLWEDKWYCPKCMPARRSEASGAASGGAASGDGEATGGAASGGGEAASGGGNGGGEATGEATGGAAGGEATSKPGNAILRRVSSLEDLAAKLLEDGDPSSIVEAYASSIASAIADMAGLLSETVTRREALIDSMKSQHAQMVEIQKQLDVAKDEVVACKDRAIADFEKDIKRKDLEIRKLKKQLAAKNTDAPTPQQQLEIAVDEYNDALSDQRFEELKALATTANQCALAAGLDDFNLNKFARERLAAQEVAADG